LVSNRGGGEKEKKARCTNLEMVGQGKRKEIEALKEEGGGN